MDLLRFYYTQNPTPMEDEDLFDAYIQSAPTTAEALLFLLHMLLMISIITEIAAAKVGKGHI